MNVFACRTSVAGVAMCVVAASLVAGCTSSSKSKSSDSATVAATNGASSSASPKLDTGNLPQALQSAYTTVVSQVLPSIVEITTSSGLGSGIVFDKAGDIVTNDHVVGTATSFDVRLATGSATMRASLVGAYPPDDLAVIKVADSNGLHPATFADSSKAKVGDIVLAMGNPLGLSGSVTEGIISATGRTVSEPRSADSPGATLPDVIQTSAAINPGNSGGALVNLQGQVVGIPTLAAQDPQMGGAAPGIGFAIPSNTVKNIADQLVKNGKVTSSNRAALGVTVVTVTDTSGNPAGAGVVSVQSGGAADKAGIKPGDIITAVGGTQTPTVDALTTVLAGMKPGDKTKVNYLDQSGNTKTADVTLGELSAPSSPTP